MTRGVQHGVWTQLPPFMIIRESIDIKATNGGQHEMLKLAFRHPPPPFEILRGGRTGKNLGRPPHIFFSRPPPILFFSRMPPNTFLFFVSSSPLLRISNGIPLMKEHVKGWSRIRPALRISLLQIYITSQLGPPVWDVDKPIRCQGYHEHKTGMDILEAMHGGPANW